MRTTICGVCGAAVLGLLSSAGTADDGSRGDWYRASVMNIHCDNHSSLFAQGAGVDAITEALRTIPCQMIQVSAQSNQYATYPTTVGLPNPNAGGYDTLGTFKAATDRLGIKLCIYMSSDRRPLEIAEHPEWAQRGADGEISLNMEPIVCQRPTRLKDGYLYERFIPQIQEIIAKYDPDGFWFDGDYILTRPCWCERCLREWKEQKGTDSPRKAGDPQWQQWLDWHFERFQGYRQLVARAIHEASPKAIYTSNWSWSRSPEPIPGFVDTLSGDVWDIGQVSRLVSRWGAQQKVPWDVMSFACPDWREYSRNYSLQRTFQEGALAFAHGGRWFAWTFGGSEFAAHGVATTRFMGDFAEDRKALMGPSVSLSQTAVLDSETTWERQGRSWNETQADAVTRSLQEAHYFADTVNEATLAQKLTAYATVIVPGQAWVSGETVRGLTEFAEAGGRLLLCGDALRGNGPEGPDAASELLGLSRTVRVTDPTPLVLNGRTFHIPGSWDVTLGDAEALARFDDGRPALTVRALGAGSVACLAADHFPYPDDGLFAEALQLLGQGPSYRVEGVGKAAVVCTLRRQGDRTLLHVVDLTARVAGQTQDVDTREFTDWNPTLRGLRVTLPYPHDPGAVAVAPALCTASSSYAGGLLTVSVGRLQTHAGVMIPGALAAPPDSLAAGSPRPEADFHPETMRGGVILAEDFEAYDVGAAPRSPWAPENRDGTTIQVVADDPAGGQRCLRLTEKPDSSFWPFFHRSVAPYVRGRSVCSFDVKVDPDIDCLFEARYEGRGAGPAVMFKGDGTVHASGRQLTTLEVGKWVRVRIAYALGAAGASYSVTLQQGDAQPQEFPNLPYATKWFYRCDSIYFVGSGAGEGAFYLDNISLERLREE